MYDSSSVYFGNHTWSHINVAKDKNVVKKEIETADTQLKEKNLNEPKTFVYPYGLESDYATKILVDMGYKLGFTTHSGRLLCKEKRMNLPRIRVGNAQLSAFGI